MRIHSGKIKPSKRRKKRLHQQNDRRIENEVFILYMPDRELVTASNLQKNPNRFDFYWNGIFTESPYHGIKPYSMVLT